MVLIILFASQRREECISGDNTSETAERARRSNAASQLIQGSLKVSLIISLSTSLAALVIISHCPRRLICTVGVRVARESLVSDPTTSETSKTATRLSLREKLRKFHVVLCILVPLQPSKD